MAVGIKNGIQHKMDAILPSTNGFTTTIHKMDFRPGGEWIFTMHGPDGTDYPNHKIFTEISYLQRIAMLHGGPPRHSMTITFEPHGQGTKLTMRHIFDSRNDYDLAVDGHGAVEGALEHLGRLDRFLKSTGKKIQEDPMNLNPYLSFKGDCAAAFKFYETAAGGKIGFVMTYGDAPPNAPVPPDMQDKVMHASMTIGKTVLMGSDSPAQFATTPAGFHISLNVETPEEAEQVYAALSEGGTIRMPIGETFWALRFAVFADKFGIPWMINCEKPMGQT